MFKSMYQIASEEGILALWQGLSASFIGVLHPLIYFPLYEKSKLYFQHNWNKDPNSSLELRYVFISAITCKAFTSLLTYPHEVVRARQQQARRAAGDALNQFTIKGVIRQL